MCFCLILLSKTARFESIQIYSTLLICNLAVHVNTTCIANLQDSCISHWVLDEKREPCPFRCTNFPEEVDTRQQQHRWASKDWVVVVVGSALLSDCHPM